MGVRITEDDAVALYDSVSGTAFGPIFGDFEEADSFLQWLRDKYHARDSYEYNGEQVYYVDDARSYPEKELVQAVVNFREEQFEEEVED